MASMRYIVNDIEKSIAFYRDYLGFALEINAPPGFAALSRGDLRLFINAPGAGGAGKAGGQPEPGGWNRCQIETDDLDAMVAKLSGAGLSFRGDIVDGKGGRQIVLDDPSGNAIELFEPAR